MRYQQQLNAIQAMPSELLSALLVESFNTPKLGEGGFTVVHLLSGHPALVVRRLKETGMPKKAKICTRLLAGSLTIIPVRYDGPLRALGEHENLGLNRAVIAAKGSAASKEESISPDQAVKFSLTIQNRCAGRSMDSFLDFCNIHDRLYYRSPQLHAFKKERKILSDLEQKIIDLSCEGQENDAAAAEHISKLQKQHKASKSRELFFLGLGYSKKHYLALAQHFKRGTQSIAESARATETSYAIQRIFEMRYHDFVSVAKQRVKEIANMPTNAFVDLVGTLVTVAKSPGVGLDFRNLGNMLIHKERFSLVDVSFLRDTLDRSGNTKGSLEELLFFMQGAEEGDIRNFIFPEDIAEIRISLQQIVDKLSTAGEIHGIAWGASCTEKIHSAIMRLQENGIVFP